MSTAQRARATPTYRWLVPVPNAHPVLTMDLGTEPWDTMIWINGTARCVSRLALQMDYNDPTYRHGNAHVTLDVEYDGIMYRVSGCVAAGDTPLPVPLTRAGRVALIHGDWILEKICWVIDPADLWTVEELEELYP
jgi:hypothetical protein